MGVVMRLIPPNVPPFERLNLPRKVLDLADEERGLILVTGITGSGKSTTWLRWSTTSTPPERSTS